MIKVNCVNIFRLSLLFFLILTIQGCLPGQNTSPPEMEVAPPVSTNVSSHRDIVLPSELEWDSSESMAINTDSFKGGIYHYSGRLELLSLKDFITTTMQNNKWKLVGEATYQKTMLAFTKPNKTCMIMLYEGIGGNLGKTHVKLYVTVDQTAANGLNPFGEPVE